MICLASFALMPSMSRCSSALISAVSLVLADTRIALAAIIIAMATVDPIIKALFMFAYDVVPPLQYVGAAAFQKPWQGFLEMFKGPINAEVNDLVIDSDGKIAYSRSIQRVSGTTNEGKPFDATFRITDVYRKINDKWVIVQEHISMPPQAARW